MGFLDDVTAYKSKRIHSKVYRALLWAEIQPSALKLDELCIKVQTYNDLKYTLKATQHFC